MVMICRPDIELGQMPSISQSTSRILNDDGLFSIAEGNRMIFYGSIATPPDHVDARQAAISLDHRNNSGFEEILINREEHSRLTKDFGWSAINWQAK